MVTSQAPKNMVFTNRVMGDRVYMLLDKGIGPDPDSPNAAYIDGSRFAEEMYHWKAQGKKCVVKINSPGGRVTQGWSMIDAILETGAETENVGIAYSMGGICLMFGSVRRAYDYASCMVHAPRGGSKVMLDVVKAQFRELLETRTKFTKKEIDEMMESGKDYFFNAEQMLAKGIIDEIIHTKRKIQVPVSATTAQLHEIFNSALIETQPQSNMENLFAKIFKKSNEEDAAVAALEMKAENDSLKAKNEELTAKVADLKKRIGEIEASAKANEAKAKATQLIENAQKEGKLNVNDEQKAKLIEMAEANYDSVKLMIDSTPAKAQPKKEKSAVAVVSDEKKGQSKTYEWLAKNDPDQLANIAENDPELFQKLQDEYIAAKRDSK